MRKEKKGVGMTAEGIIPFDTAEERKAYWRHFAAVRAMSEPDFRRRPLNKIEAALEPLEASWVDFLYGARLRRRYIRADSRSGMRVYGLREVHRILEGYREQLARGERIAIFSALACCIEENVPLPYWLGDEILDIKKRANREPSSLHELFGLDSLIPASGKRARTARQNMQWQLKLWSTASELMAKSPKMSKDDAIEQAREKIRGFPYAQRKSRDMFDEQERIFRQHVDAVEGTRKHRMK